MNNEPVTGPGGGKGLLGSLRDALAAAGREDVATENKRQMEARVQSKAATRATPDDDTQRLAPAKEPLALAAPGSAEDPSAGGAPDASAAGGASSGQAAAIALPNADTAELSAASEAIAQNEALAPAEQVADMADMAAEPASAAEVVAIAGETTMRQSAADAARQARGEVRTRTEEHHIEMEEPTTKLAHAGAHRDDKASSKTGSGDAPPRTQLVRGKAKVGREGFDDDPVVGWLVIVGGPGLGAFRPIFEGNNTVGRSSSQRVPIDFGDEAISSEEQAYIRYDSMDRSFLFVPNLAKTNVVQVNSQKPTSAVPLSGMDVITMGRTQLVFVPFCSADFDWSELSDLKE